MLQQFEVYGGRIINTTGRHFRYVSGTSASGNVGLVVLVDNVPQGVYYPGDAIEYPTDYGRWEVRGLQADLVATVSIGAGKVASQRLDGTMTISGGTVTAVAPDLAHVLAGQGMQGAQSIEFANAGCWPMVQLWNPAGSGRVLHVDGVQLRTLSTSDETVTICRDTVEMALPSSTRGGVNVDSLGPASVAAVHRKLNMLAAAAQSQIAGLPVLFSSRGKDHQWQLEAKRPLIVRPGQGLTVSVMQTDRGLSCAFQWREVNA